MQDLSKKQAEAAEKIKKWYTGRESQIFRMFGYAGAGKTTTIDQAVSALGANTVYAAYTGKAAAVMRAHGIPHAQTIHSLIYKCKEGLDGKLHFHLNPDSIAQFADLIVLDECSMVGEKVARDILSFGKPVLVIGDPGQLPPVKDTGFLIKGTPDVMLTEVHRQSAGNPILALATDVRNGLRPAYGRYGKSEILHVDDLDDDRLWAADQVIVGLNKTRKMLNRKARKHFGFPDPVPMFGEKVVCLRNNYAYNIFNGETFNVLSCVDHEDMPDFVNMSLIRTEGPSSDVVENVVVHKAFFVGEPDDLPQWIRLSGAEFDFGHTITCHKSQGSQWNNVLVFDQSGAFKEDANKWLYTAITRAAESVTIVRGRI